MLDIPPPTDVITLVLLAWATGTAAFGALTRLGGEVQPGHFKVVWLTTAGLSFAAGFGQPLSFGLAGVCVLTFVSIYRGGDQWAGIVTSVAALATLAVSGPPYGFAVALLLGCVTNAMLLGHWHLNQPGLSTGPLSRLIRALWVVLAIDIAATVALVTMGGPDGVQTLGGVTAIAFTAFCGILTAMVAHLVGTRSIMSATGILYLEILMLLVSAFTGSLAALA